MGGRLCYAVYPGDIATAMMPYDPPCRSPGRSAQELTMEQLVPGDMMVDGRLQSHVVRFNEILTEVSSRAEAELQGLVREDPAARVWDFAMASLAMACSCRAHVQDSRVSSSAASPASRIARGRWRSS
jgi:CO/xanthine dehydrogenase FAD-binding subunit